MSVLARQVSESRLLSPTRVRQIKVSSNVIRDHTPLSAVGENPLDIPKSIISDGCRTPTYNDLEHIINVVGFYTPGCNRTDLREDIFIQHASDNLGILDTRLYLSAIPLISQGPESRKIGRVPELLG